MKGVGRNGRTLVRGTIAAAAIGLFTWWFVSGLAICPSIGDPALECRAEAHRIGLRAAAIVGGFVALVTAVIILSRRTDR
jgi:hypothetical protein